MSDLSIINLTIASLYAQYTKVLEEKNLVISLMNTADGSTPYTADVLSKSKSGEAGSTSFSYSSLNSRLSELRQLETGFTNIIQWKLMAAREGPGIIKGCYYGS